jgi:hypothetical protein
MIDDTRAEVHVQYVPRSKISQTAVRHLDRNKVAVLEL